MTHRVLIERKPDPHADHFFTRTIHSARSQPNQGLGSAGYRGVHPPGLTGSPHSPFSRFTYLYRRSARSYIHRGPAAERCQKYYKLN